jgi:hypothetical protein
MPDQILMIKATAVAGGLAAALLLALTWPRPRASAVRVGVAWVLAIAVAFVAGAWMLGYRPSWPIAQDRDRLLLILLPAAVVIELLGSLRPACGRWGRAAHWVLRLALAGTAGRILLYHTSYLTDLSGPGTRLWSRTDSWLWLKGMAAALLVDWVALTALAHRAKSGGSGASGGSGGSGGRVIPLALALAIAGSALTIMLSGSLTTGQPALALAAALVGATIASLLLPAAVATTASLGVALVIWFGLLVSGRFFAELTMARAATLFFAPLLCWLPELLPAVRRRRPWVRAATCLLLVAIPIAIVVFQAQRQFAKDSAGGVDYGASGGDYSNFQSK